MRNAITRPLAAVSATVHNAKSIRNVLAILLATVYVSAGSKTPGYTHYAAVGHKKNTALRLLECRGGKS
jgi:hypothetical protein